MNLYAAYLKEREGLEILELDHGFATYKLRPDGCYIQDIYVIPAFRKEGIASLIADEISRIAKQAGHHVLIGSIDERSPGVILSGKVLEAYSMKPYMKEGYVTYYFKELN